MIENLSLLLAAEPAWLSETIEPAPVLPDFAPNPKQVNDPRTRLPIIVTVDSPHEVSGGINATTIQFLVPSNGAFGIANVYKKDSIIPL